METELTQTLPIMTKSKLDKAQARRLKMPKRNRSAYFLFSMDTRAKLKTEYRNNLTPLEMQGKVSQYWKELSFEEKEKYEQRARDEKVEYLAAMEKFYSNLTPETLEKSKSNKPKKPCSAYAHFVHDVKTELKKDNPKLIMQEILHIVSDKWKNLDETTRALYEERARIDKEQYMTAIKKYNLDNQESPEPTSTVSEKPIVKKVKLETISTRAESQGEVEEQTVRLVKIEEVQDLSNASGSPNTIRITPETAIMPQMTMIEPVFLPQSIQGLQGLQMPGLNVKMQPNMYPNPMFGGEKMKEMMLAKLSWARFMEANNNLEHAIAKRIAEVRNLQAQQYMFAQKVFLASNTAPF